MSQQGIAVLALALLSGIGACLIAVAIVLRIRTNNYNKSCTNVTEGKVISYIFPGDGRMAPVVEFSINGSRFICKKKFNGYKKVVVTPSKEYPTAWEDEDGYLCLRRGMFADLRQLACDIWPLGMEMAVYYNPINPSINYAGKPTTNSFVIRTFIISGIGLIVLGFLMFWTMI